MYRIIESRGVGKTSRLMLLAKEHNGILICANPMAMRGKAEAYGLTGFDIISYYDYLQNNYDKTKPCFVDEIENYVKYTTNNLFGYTLSKED